MKPLFVLESLGDPALNLFPHPGGEAGFKGLNVSRRVLFSFTVPESGQTFPFHRISNG
jgi:hypothetical protein